LKRTAAGGLLVFLLLPLLSCITSGASTFRPLVMADIRTSCAASPDVSPPFESDPYKLAPEALLSAYLKVNTTSPDGCEGKAARFWKKFFDQYGVEAEVISLPFGTDRANIIARVRGDNKARPLILHHHLDVAPLPPGQRTVHPFAGEIKDGFVYGHGALDMKATGVYHALALVKAASHKWNLNRDLVFLGTANEEGGVALKHVAPTGAQWMLKNRPRDFGSAAFVITEGGSIPMGDGGQIRWEVSTAEKARLEMTFKPAGAKKDDADVNLMMALAAHRIMTGFSRPIELDDPEQRERILSDPSTRANYETTHALTVLGGRGKRTLISGSARADLLFAGGARRRTALEAELRRLLPQGVGMAEIRQNGDDLRIQIRATGPEVSAALPPRDGGASVLLVSAVAAIHAEMVAKKLSARRMIVTDIFAGAEVAPGVDPVREAGEFVIDARLIPGEQATKIVAEINALISGTGAEMSVSGEPVIAPQSSTDTLLFKAIVAAGEHFGQTLRQRPPVETPILTTTTAASYFRKKGMTVYGFEPLPSDTAQSGAVGFDERIPVASLKFAAEVTDFYLRYFLINAPRNSATDAQ